MRNIFKHLLALFFGEKMTEKMTENISLVERMVRVFLGVLLILGYVTHFWHASFGMSATMELVLLIIGAILFTTGAIGYCPLYNMCAKREEKNKEEIPVRSKVEVVENESVGEVVNEEEDEKKEEEVEEKKIVKKKGKKRKETKKTKAKAKTTKVAKAKSKKSRKKKKSKKKK
jgi:outer membrane biosynthesis protein TonB